jgi:ATP-binding cassette subfamily B (MDR/TAP) protein 1
MTKYTQGASTFIAEAGSLAEEVFSSIRTAQAFGAQKTLTGLFDGYVQKACVVGIKGARISSVGLATMFFVSFRFTYARLHGDEKD